MTLEAALFAYLSAHPAVTAAVGTRIYPLVLPQNPVLPAVVYQRIGGARPLAYDGAIRLAEGLIQLDAWARTLADAKDLAVRIRSALHGFRGTMADLIVRGAQVENELDQYEAETSRYRVMLEVRLWYVE